MRQAYERHIEKMRNHSLSQNDEKKTTEIKSHVKEIQESSLQLETNKVQKQETRAKNKRTKLVMEPIQIHKITSKRKQQQVETPKSTVTTETECQSESLPKEIFIESSPHDQSKVPWHSPKPTSHSVPIEHTNDNVSPLPSLDGFEALAIRPAAALQSEHFLEKIVLSSGNIVAGGSDETEEARYIPRKKLVGVNSQEASTMLDWPYLPVLNSRSCTGFNAEKSAPFPSQNPDPQRKSKRKGKTGPIQPILPFEAKHPLTRKRNARTPRSPIDYGSV
jgi:hypothetical protein